MFPVAIHRDDLLSTVCENTINTNLAQKSLQGYLKNLDPEVEHNCNLYGKVPWIFPCLLWAIVVSIKKVNTGGGSGLAMPTRWNGRQAASEVSHEQKFYVTTKVDITPGADVPTDLRKENHKLLSTLK